MSNMLGRNGRAIMTWEEYFMLTAIIISSKSKDNSTKVGSVIVDPTTKKVLSTGYNGFPSNFAASEVLLEEFNKYPYTIHSEMNAILLSSGNLIDKHLYVTHFPCENCAKHIAQSGISKLYYLKEETETFKPTPIAKDLLKNIEVEQMTISDETMSLIEETFSKAKQ